MEFKEKEIKDFVLSIFSISTLFIISNLFSNTQFLNDLFIGLIITTISLFTKIYAEKRVAEKYDCNVVYNFEYNLFLISLLIGFLTGGTIIFPIVGTITVISAYYTRLGHKYVNITQREKGLINLSGPISNIILALISLILYPINNYFFQQLLNLNVLMSVFSLIPAPPLEGSKVLWWNRLVWLITFLISLFLVFAGQTILFSIIGIILLIIITFILWEKMF